MARLLTAPCPGEPEIVTEVAEFMDSTVWTAFTLPTVELPPNPAVSLANGWVPNFLSFAPTQEAHTIHVALAKFAPGAPAGTLAEEKRTVFVDLYSGTEAPNQLFAVHSADLPEGLPPELHPQARGWPTGPAAALGFVQLHQFGTSTPRLLVWSDSSWASVEDGCALPAQHLFNADGKVWSAWVQGTDVAWSEITPP